LGGAAGGGRGRVRVNATGGDRVFDFLNLWIFLNVHVVTYD
jgi:hypothetical protein